MGGFEMPDYGVCKLSQGGWGCGFRGAIFDLDGTLLDSMGLWVQVDIDFLKKRGHFASKEYLQAIKPMGFYEAAKYTVSRFNLKETAEEVQRELGGMCRSAYEHDIRLKPGAKEYLIHLKDAGVSLGVATALGRDLFEPVLKNNGIFDLFGALASLDEVRRGKGFPDIYLLAAERLKIAPAACVVFEDILLGILGAKAGGFMTCGVYDKSSAHEWDKIKEAADWTVKGFDDEAGLRRSI
jgi:HAD superfamily hydrolase (TIGR01509 family)